MSQPSSQREAPRAKRNCNFSDQEDIALTQAWITITNDPITGTNQTMERFWDRIFEEFMTLSPSSVERTRDSCRTHFGAYIKKECQFYTNCLRKAYKCQASGENLMIMIRKANRFYKDGRKGKGFEYEDCHELLSSKVTLFNYMTKEPIELPFDLNQASESVLYVAFGSQAQLTNEQLREITVGLEKSEATFLWVLRSECTEFDDGFEERVKGRGIVVKEWVNQVEILSHESVNGFLSHCGWNSVMESICESVPILAWPMMAEQHLNARFVVDDLGIGVRVLARNGSVRGFVGAECVEEMVRELMEGDKGKEVRKRVKEYGEMAKKAMGEGVGSSWNTLDLLIEEIGGMLVSDAKASLHPAYSE